MSWGPFIACGAWEWVRGMIEFLLRVGFGPVGSRSPSGWLAERLRSHTRAVSTFTVYLKFVD